MFTYHTVSPEETYDLAYRLGAFLPQPMCITLIGGMGVGKTVFATGLAHGLGAEGEITSPTYTLMHIYEGRYRICHFDLYRLGDNEAEELGFEEYFFDPQTVSIIEWPQSGLPKHRIEIEICPEGENGRMITINPIGNTLEGWE